MNTRTPYESRARCGHRGLPLPGIEVKVTDPATARPAPGETGQIVGGRVPRFQGLLTDAGKDRRRNAQNGFVHHRRSTAGSTGTVTCRSSGATRT